MSGALFTIAAVCTAAFGGPTWAWLSLGLCAVLELNRERRA